MVLTSCQRWNAKEMLHKIIFFLVRIGCLGHHTCSTWKASCVKLIRSQPIKQNKYHTTTPRKSTQKTPKPHISLGTLFSRIAFGMRWVCNYTVGLVRRMNGEDILQVFCDMETVQSSPLPGDAPRLPQCWSQPWPQHLGGCRGAQGLLKGALGPFSDSLSSLPIFPSPGF